MKKTIAIMLIIAMLLSLTACKSKEQKAADEYLEKLEKLVNDFVETFENQELEKHEALMDEIFEIEEDYEDIYEDLEKVDEEAAEAFEKAYDDLIDVAHEILFTTDYEAWYESIKEGG